MTSASPSGLSPAVPISPDHRTSGFQCGQPALDAWLKDRALRSEGRSARTYVLVDGEDVIGYYCILTGGIDRGALPRRLAGDMPLIAPIVLIGRFAVDRRFQGKGVGRALLRDALKRCYAISQMAGVRAVLVHAIDEDARAFYLRAGFEPFPDHGRTLFLAIRHIAALI